MAPATWQDVYATISARNALERGHRARAILGRKRALSPVDWSVMDNVALVHAEDSSDWAEDWSSSAASAGDEAPNSLAMEHCPGCGARTYG